MWDAFRAAAAKAVAGTEASVKTVAEQAAAAKEALVNKVAEPALKAAEEKAAAEKGAALKAASEKAAAEKDDAVKMTAEKAAAQKESDLKAMEKRTSIEKEAAVRAVAEMAAAEKEAALKMAADKAAAEKDVAVRAAVDMVAAQMDAAMKVAAERALAERASGEKALLEKALLEKALLEGVAEAASAELEAVLTAAAEKAKVENDLALQAAEKATADKEAAVKAAAEEAAAEKQAAVRAAAANAAAAKEIAMRTAQMPTYWTSMATNAEHGFSVIPVHEPNLFAQLARLLDVNNPSELGKGRDASTYKRSYTGFALHAAWRIEHPGLWSHYRASCKTISAECAMCRSQGVLPAEFTPSTASATTDLPGPRRADANEAWLLHGCGPNAVLPILQRGLNEKLCALRSAFGAGIYLAEEAAKIDQYTAPHSPFKKAEFADLRATLYPSGRCGCTTDIFYCFVVRTLCGYPMRTKNGLSSIDNPEIDWIYANTPQNPSSRTHTKCAGPNFCPDCKDDKAGRRELTEVRGVNPPVRYHSLLVERERALKRFREIVCFEKSQTYCEYLLAYRRT